MSALTVDRNAEGAWRVAATVIDPTIPADSWFDAREWYEARTFYGYTKAEAMAGFRAYVRAHGWEVAR